MISIEKVNKYYNKGKSNQIHVINDTSLTLPDKGIFCILGPSGCGKTTLLNAIGGLDRVNSGTISIDGQVITRGSSDSIDNLRNAHIGYIFQNYNLLDDRTVFENVAIALRMTGIRDEETVTARVRYCLEKVGLDQYRKKPAGSLSGGQRQRVAIARAIVKNPKIIIADEPTGNLDSANTLEVMNIIKTISRDKLVILVTHERNIAEFYADHVAEMKDGKITATYDNDTSRYLDYQLDNKIYLKDMEVHKGWQQDGVSIDLYSDNEPQTAIKLVIRDNNLYIDTGGALNIIDGSSNVQLVDEHYTALDESYFENNGFDYTEHLPAGYQAKYTSVYRISNILSNGWKAVKRFRPIKKILLLGFVFAAMFSFLAISNVFGLLEVKPVDYRTTNANYITVTSMEKTAEILDLMGTLETVSFALPGETKKSVALPLDDYVQTDNVSENINVSIVYSSVLDPDTLIAGSMPKDAHDVVIDKSIVDSFLRDELGKTICLDRPGEFIGRRISVPNLEDYRIVGIANTESPSLFVDPGQAMYILSNANDAVDDNSYSFGGEEMDNVDVVKSGKVKDVDITKSKLKIEEGRMPKKAYETIVNAVHSDGMKIGETISTQAAGHDLKVVGYYTSDYADDDAFYVTAETIRNHYASTQTSVSVYAQDIPLLKHVLDKTGVPSSINDIRDKNMYISEHKNQLMSSLAVAAVIVLISLVEMYLMLRSSFLSRIKEVGTLRAIGLKKKDIYRMFLGEILVITLITAIPGIAIMYFLLGQVVTLTYFIEGMYILTPRIALITFALMLVFNLLAGLIPVFTTMRKTPAQILARTDI